MTIVDIDCTAKRVCPTQTFQLLLSSANSTSYGYAKPRIVLPKCAELCIHVGLQLSFLPLSLWLLPPCRVKNKPKSMLNCMSVRYE